MRKNKRFKYNTQVKQHEVDYIRYRNNDRYHLLLEGDDFRGQRWYCPTGVTESRSEAGDYTLNYAIKVAERFDSESAGAVKCTIMPAYGDAMDLIFIIHRYLRRYELYQKSMYFV